MINQFNIGLGLIWFWGSFGSSFGLELCVGFEF